MLLAWVAAAEAHRPGMSYARVTAEELRLTIAEPELVGRVPLGADIDASRVLVAELLLPGTHVRVDGVECDRGDPTLGRVEGDGILLTVPLECPVGALSYTPGFLDQMDPGHRHIVDQGGEPVAVVDRPGQIVALEGAAAPGQVALRFGELGVEHIWTGYDHLLFLAGLLLTATSLRAMLWVVTGFTVAHSITLTGAALGWIALPSAVVEPAIAASIVYVGIENLWRPSPRRRAVVTFLLGLVHGFGFAGLLAELGLPKSGLLTALVSFNLGVEVGQAAVVALLLPLLLRLRRGPWFDARVVPVASVCVALAGLYWLVERVFG